MTPSFSQSFTGFRFSLKGDDYFPVSFNYGDQDKLWDRICSFSDIFPSCFAFVSAICDFCLFCPRDFFLSIVIIDVISVQDKDVVFLIYPVIHGFICLCYENVARPSLPFITRFLFFDLRLVKIRKC